MKNKVDTETKEAPVQEARQVPAQVEKRQPRQVNWYWVLLGGGIGLLVMAILVGAYWMTHPPNMFTGGVVVASLVGGIILVRRQIKHRHERGGGKAAVVVRTAAGATPPQVSGNGLAPNSLCIYADMDEYLDMVVPKGIVFQHVEKPLGQPQKCLNDGKDYYVHIFDYQKDKLVPFVLPDRRFTDPMEMARYLGLPAQRKYLRNRDTLMKYIGPGLLLIADIGILVGIIALSGG